MGRKKQMKSDDIVINPIKHGGDEDTAGIIVATAAAAAAALAEAAGVSIVDPSTASELLLSSEMNALADASMKNDLPLPPGGHISYAHHDDMLQGSNNSNTMESGDSLEKRRRRDRQKYANMSETERTEYNLKRRAQYHRQSDQSRKKRRERERRRYHALTSDEAKQRNERRAAMERERYKHLSKDELEERNKRRRERASQLRRDKGGASVSSSHSNNPMDDAVKEATEAAIAAAAAVTSFDLMEASTEVEI
jgi:hypothetical protein